MQQPPAPSRVSTQVLVRARLGFWEDLTTFPIVGGIDNVVKGANLKRGTPTEIRAALAEGELDAALVPTSEFLTNSQLSLINTACLSVNGQSNLFLLVSKVFPGEISHVLVDAEDLGATPLAELALMRQIHTRPQFHRSEVPIHPHTHDFHSDPHDAFLLVGENALFAKKALFTWTCDLTNSWHQLTGLQFPIFVWACKRGMNFGPLDKELGDVPKRALSQLEGFSRRESERLGIPPATLDFFISRILRSDFGPPEMTALRRFGRELQTAELVPPLPQAQVYAPPPARR